ncbi:MAG TPA: alpha/beta hydrolase [Chthoniobacter sp.]|nr:alpha/beta hydrolase [Chthoniobacter sp.]
MNAWLRSWIGALFGLLLATAQGADVLQVTWPTTHASEPPHLTPEAARLLPAFRLGVQALPEAATVALVLSQPTLLNLTPTQAGRLAPLTAERYRLMAQSPTFAKAASALPYCYSEQKPDYGLASVYVPDGVGPETPTIVFVHGYGGSFLWYQHYLSEVFPDRIIICPAYGITTAFMPVEYLSESIAAVSKRLGLPLAKRALLGLSAGGYGACEMYVAAPSGFSQFLCLACSPPPDTVGRFQRDAQPRFLSGGDEPFVVSGEFQRNLELVRKSCPGLEAATIPGADHFFLLTHREATMAYLRRWLASTR